MRALALGFPLFLALGVAVASGGCARGGRGAAARGSVVALVGDRSVEWPDVSAYIRQSTGEDPKGVSPKVASSLLDQFLEERLLERAVEEAAPKIEGPTPADRRRELIGRRANLAAIDEPLLRKEWEARRAKEGGTPLVRVSQLIFKNRESADQAQKRLARGEAWIDVSRSASVAPNAPTGGALGFLAADDLPPTFRSAIWGLPAGGMTPILSAPHGFHIFRVEERRDRRAGTFEEERVALRLALAEERSRVAVDAILEESARAHPVRIVEEHLPFPYVGTFPKHPAL